MIIYDMQQGTPAWELWRHTGIGGSDVACILGYGFVSREQLMEEKLGLRKREVTFPMRRGLKMEGTVRRAFEKETGLVCRPCCAIHDELNWAKASLDGIGFMEDWIAEYKCPNFADHEVALAGVVPQKYVPQLQHEMFCCGVDLCYYVSFSVAERFGGPEKPSLVILEVQPNAEFLATMLDAEENFWNELQQRKEAVKQAC